MAVIDCFTFFNELDILEIRLQELWNTVDFFVLVEATVSHSCKPKPLFFADSKDRFQPYMDKIKHVIVEDMPVSDPNSWVRENYQRDCIQRGLPSLNRNDLIITSDADEIPRASVIAQLQTDTDPFHRAMLSTPLFQYKLNFMRVYHQGDYRYPIYRQQNIVVTRAQFYTSPQQERSSSFWWIREIPANTLLVDHGGWHWSYYGGTSHAINKIRNFAHTECDTPELITSYDVNYLIENKCGHYGLSNPERYEYVLVDDYFPKVITENLSTYEHMIIPNALVSARDLLNKTN